MYTVSGIYTGHILSIYGFTILPELRQLWSSFNENTQGGETDPVLKGPGNMGDTGQLHIIFLIHVLFFFREVITVFVLAIAIAIIDKSIPVVVQDILVEIKISSHDAEE